MSNCPYLSYDTLGFEIGWVTTHNCPRKIMVPCGHEQIVSDMSISSTLSLVKHIVCSCLGFFCFGVHFRIGKRNKKTRNTWLSKLNQHTVSSYTPTSFILCHHSTQDAHVEFITENTEMA